MGAGKVGFSLGKFFTVTNLNVRGYYSRSEASAREAAEFTNTAYFREVQDLIKNSDIIFITVPDDEIFSVYSSIKNNSLNGKILCHCSGSLSSNIFSGIDDFDAFSYSIHPIFPIYNKYESYRYLKDAVFTIEGHPRFLNALTELFERCKVKILPIQQSDKRLYHLAAVTVSNLFLALVKRSCGYLKQYGFSEEEALQALYPLMLSNINNALDKGVLNALTGPAERGDLNTIAGHIDVIPAEHRSAYRDLTRELISMAEEKNPNRDYSSLEEYLKG
ncbi:MAG: DUF2520 domain-containing protein [Bacillota bacterium]|nr:DUF2520 domain-containing protein [Bacillota bacterium]